MIISDSIPVKIGRNQLIRNIDTNEEDVIFKKFPGHTADEISFYSSKSLEDSRPNRVIILAGTNDISRDVYQGRTVNEFEVVENLMKIARTARAKGAQKIHVSAILVRHGYQYKNPIKRINNLLQSTCATEGFLFMDQSDISSSHISVDGVHPNFYGQTLLKMNILNCFHTFNPYFIDFEYDYDKSLF